MLLYGSGSAKYYSKANGEAEVHSEHFLLVQFEASEELPIEISRLAVSMQLQLLSAALAVERALSVVPHHDKVKTTTLTSLLQPP